MDLKQVKKIFKGKLVVFIILALFIIPVFVFAQDANFAEFSSNAGIQTQSSLPVIIGTIVKTILGFLGIVAILLILFAGFKWMTSEGDPTKVEKARKIIIGAVIGLVIIFSAFAIVTFIFNKLWSPSPEPPSGPCISGETRTASSAGVANCAYSICENGVWSAWNYENCYFFSRNQYSHISGFKDENILIGETPWFEAVSKDFNGVKSIPQSSSTQVRGYGHFKGASNIINGMVLNWLNNSASGTSALSPINNLIKTINGSEYNVVDSAFAPWNTSSFTQGSTSTLQIILSPQDSSYFYKILKVKIINKHCFDQIQNNGETGIDCGTTSGCGACPGESCNLASVSATCTADDSMCRYGICEKDSCLCASPPKIDYISPAFDEFGDTKLYNSNTWEDDVPNGAKGNYITIWGTGFGKSTGTVTFIDKNDPSKTYVAIAPPCRETWRNNQIVVQIPETDKFENVTSSKGLEFNTSTNYYVSVSNSDGLSGDQKSFQVNLIDRPNICSATEGSFPATTTISGFKFPNTEAETKNVIWTVGSYVGGIWTNNKLTNATWSDVDATNTPPLLNWTSNSVIDNIPEVESRNTANIRIFNGKEFSNYYSYVLTNGGAGDSCGFYDNTCMANNGYCQDGLKCDYSSCVCKTQNICRPGTVSTTSCTVSNPIPNCDYVNMCKQDGSGYNCVPRSDDADCKQNIISALAGQALYTWAFNTKFNRGVGSNCGIDAWGVCDPRGCDAGLVCDVASATNPCTCVVGSQCKSGEKRSCNSGAVIASTCSEQEICIDGAWGKCELVDPFCVPLLYTTHQSIYAWLFNYGSGSINGNPYVVEDCNPDLNCSKRQPPSPSPWYMEHSARTEGYFSQGPASSAACKNADIQARFSETMYRPSLTTTTVRLYRFAGTSTNYVQVTATSSLTEDGKLLNISGLFDAFATSTHYQVALFDGIVSDSNKPLIFNPKYSSDINYEKNTVRDCVEDAVYCWNFVTRDTDAKCDEGCVDCYKDPTRMTWQGQTSTNYSLVYSQDNSCIALDPSNYDWVWRVSPDKTAGISLSKNDYVEITNRDICSTTTADSTICRNHTEASDGNTDPIQTSTGLLDTLLSTVSTTINTFIKGRDHFVGKCEVINNFKDVVVQEDWTCNSGTTQSPTPYKGTLACRNALISARFNRPIVDNNIKLNTSLNKLNLNGQIIIEECDDGNIGPSSTSTCHIFDFNGVTPSLKIFDYSHPLSQDELFSSTSTNTNAEGFLIDINANQIKYVDERKGNDKKVIDTGYLRPNYWYRVVLLGGDDGIRGSKLISSTDTNIKEGHLITPMYGTKMFNYNNGTTTETDEEPDAQHDYYWTFRAGTTTCDAETVSVQPKYSFTRLIGGTQEYDAIPQAANCNILARCLMDWDWSSLLTSSTPHTYDPKNPLSIGDAFNLASITRITSTPGICMINGTTTQDSFNFVDPVQTSTAKVNGKAYITAMESSNTRGYGIFKIGNDEFNISSIFPEPNCKCVNSSIRIGFNMPARINSVDIEGSDSNIKLFKCADDQCLATDFTPLQLFADNPVNYASTGTQSFIQLKTYSGDNYQLEPGQTYKVVVRGLNDVSNFGITSFDDKLIENLNYVFSGSATNTYAWKFTVDNDATKCGPKIELNPCPKGVWRMSVGKDIKNLRVVVDQILTGTSAPNATCELTDFGITANTSIFAKIWYKIKTFIKKFVGVASASNYWCKILDNSFDQNSLKAMDKGNFTKQLQSYIHAIAYSDSNSRIINYVTDINTPNSSWTEGNYYRVILESDDGFGTTTVTSTIQIYNNIDDINSKCLIDNVKAEVWPDGTQKENDTFFCYGSYCGANSYSEKMDDDQSASWNKDFDYGPLNNNLAGNQHLYRFWSYGKTNYRLRSAFGNGSFLHFNSGAGSSINASTTIFNPTSTYPLSVYNGARWVTAGNIQGYDLFRVKSADSMADIYAGITQATGTVKIQTFFCTNPWPDYKNFPLVDRLNNCNVGSTNCPNTNFATFYCRDRGIISKCVSGADEGKTCETQEDCLNGRCEKYEADDLPAIGSYNAGEVSAAITGTVKQNCSNLPNDFVPSLGYYSNLLNEGAVYLWDTTGNIYRSVSISTGWEFISRGSMTQLGFPSNIKPIAGYTTTSFSRLIDGNGNVYDNFSSKWTKNATLTKALQNDNFKPIGGYYNQNNALVLWDSSAKVATSSGHGDFNITTNYWGSPKIYPSVAYRTGGNDQMWDLSGKFYTFNGSKWVTSTIPTGLPSGFKPKVAYNIANLTPNELVLWDGQKSYASTNTGATFFLKNSNTSKECVTKLKEFLFTPNNDTANLNSYTNGIDFNISGGEAVFYGGKITRNTSSTILSTHCVSYGSNYSSQCRGANSGALMPDGIKDGFDFEYIIDVPVDGKYYLNINTSNNYDITSKIIGNPQNTGIACGQTGIYDGTGNVYHNIELYVDNDTTRRGVVSAVASAPSNIQTNKFPEALSLSQGKHLIKLRWTNDCNSGNYTGWTWDSNLAIYDLSATRYFDEAIGIRVMSNDNHYPALTWYNNWFNIKGSPSASLVDSYRAVSDGRTIYVNAANTTNEATPKVYTNIYLMSRSQGGSVEIENIFNQMVKNWTFNYNLMNTENNGNVGYCFNTTRPCLFDSDCSSGNYCTSNKAKITRDTKRVEDISQMYSLLLKYYDIKRCNNDQTKLCLDDSNCYGGGKCSNYFPEMKAGSYITGKTYSTWPSWQSTLGKQLGSGLANDPINKFYGCGSPFNVSTCWDEVNKVMKAPASSSSAYLYYAYNATGTRLYAKSEFDTNGNSWLPKWGNVNPLRYNPFRTWDDDSMSDLPSSPLPTCGNKTVQVGENCANCPLDVTCASDKICQPSNASADNKGCVAKAVCGNGIKELREECDCGDTAIAGRCDSKPNNDPKSGCIKVGESCELAPGYKCNNDACTKPFKCGDGKVDPGEQCDPGNGAEILENLNGKTCSDIIPGSCKDLSCRSDCKFNTSQCEAPRWECDDWATTTGGFEIRECCSVNLATVTTTAQGKIQRCLFQSPYNDVRENTCGNTLNMPITKRVINCEVDYSATCDGKCGTIASDPICGKEVECGGCPGRANCDTVQNKCITCNENEEYKIDGVTGLGSCACIPYFVKNSSNVCVPANCPSEAPYDGVRNECVCIDSSKEWDGDSCEGVVPDTFCGSPANPEFNQTLSEILLNSSKLQAFWDLTGLNCMIISSPLNISIDVSQQGADIPEDVAIVLVTDLSGSMAGNPITAVKNAQPVLIDGLLKNLSQYNVKIASIGFANSGIGWIHNNRLLVNFDNKSIDLKETEYLGVELAAAKVSNLGITDYSPYFMDTNKYQSNFSSNISELSGLINQYEVYNKTPTLSGVALAGQMLNSFSPTTKKIMIILSDGDPSDGYDPSSYLTTLKNGIEIYSAAFTAEANTEVMNNWSSNSLTPSVSCGSGYCYSDLASADSVYNKISVDLLSRLLANVKLDIFDYNNQKIIPTLDFGGMGNRIVTLNITPDYCGKSNAIKFVADGITIENKGQIKINSTELKYCKSDTLGAYDEKKLSFYDKIKSMIMDPILFILKLFNFNK